MDVGKVLALGGEGAPFKASLCNGRSRAQQIFKRVGGPVMIIVEQQMFKLI